MECRQAFHCEWKPVSLSHCGGGTGKSQLFCFSTFVHYSCDVPASWQLGETGLIEET